jgi:hypothetical protein
MVPYAHVGVVELVRVTVLVLVTVVTGPAVVETDVAVVAGPSLVARTDERNQSL